jgi:hypothetical protein
MCLRSTPPLTPYERELADGIIALDGSFNVRNQINTLAWHPEIVKIALGLASLTFGEAFITSPDADVLRAFLWELDPEKRGQIEGHAGIGPDATPTATRVWAGDHGKHLFALIAAGDYVVLLINLFRKWENLVSIGERKRYEDRLAGSTLKGVAWVVDGEMKTTEGPRPALEFLLPRPER